jgi:hypothetical protein
MATGKRAHVQTRTRLLLSDTDQRNRKIGRQYYTKSKLEGRLMNWLIFNLKEMEKTIKYFSLVFVLALFSGCNPYDTWPIGLPHLEHVYYVSNVKTGNGTEQDLQHEIAANGTARFMKRIHYNPAPPAGTPLFEWINSDEPNVTCPMDIRFICEYVRPYDVVTYFWVETRSGGLQQGRDYTVLGPNGSPLTPDGSGAYSLTWPQAKKGQQSIKIRRNSTTTGELRMVFLERSRMKFTATDSPDRDDLDQTLLNNKTNDYTVRGFWHDYRFPVIVRFQ